MANISPAKPTSADGQVDQRNLQGRGVESVIVGVSAAQTCNPVDLAKAPWAFDTAHALPVYGPGASEDDHAPASTPVQGDIPARYKQMSDEELDRRIRSAKQMLGDRLIVLGHHYQRDEIIQYADIRGDSFLLSREAARRHDADYIVFCGVHFMAESADILAGDHQRVILPNMAAGCSMADMANIDDVETAWEQLSAVLGERSDDGSRAAMVPVTYMNSAASLKSFCGEHEGIVCTSSNAERVLDWAFERGQRVLFFPDQHLGRNTGLKMGIPLEQMVLWNPRKKLGGNTPEALRQARIILWMGWCSVHKRFNLQQIKQAREQHPGINILVHPECPMDVVLASDYAGSTEYIIKKVAEAPAGSKWAIGTEINLVRRLQAEHPDKLIFCLDPVVCPCSTMYRIHPAYLAWVLDELVDGRIVNEIIVEDTTKRWAKVSLDRMLAVP